LYFVKIYNEQIINGDIVKKNSIYYFLLIILFFGFDLSAYTPLTDNQINRLIPSDTRVITSLAGTWQKSYDEINWEKSELPFSEEIEKTVIYQRTVRIDRNLIESNAWHLYFLGIDHQVEIFINEQFVGKYFGGMAPFKVRIPDRMMSVENNSIKFIISPAMNYARQTRSQFLYAKKIYTGLVREVFLVGTPPLWISEVKYKTNFNDDLTNCDLKASIGISSAKIDKLKENKKLVDSLGRYISDSGFSIEAMLVDISTKDTISRSKRNSFNIESERTIYKDIDFQISDFKLWSPENPELYNLAIKIRKDDKLIDNYNQSIGLRDVEIRTNTDNPIFYLNNENVELKGVTYIEDYIDGNQTIDAVRFEKDIELLKTLGANVVRSKFLAPHPYFVDLCNRNGLLLLIELPLYDVPSPLISLKEIQVHIENIGVQMIESYNNNPAVIAWGISDGLIEGNPNVRNFSKKMIDLFRTETDKLVYKIIPYGSQNIDIEGYDFIGIRNNRTNLSFNEISDEVERIKKITNNFPIFSSYGVPVQDGNRNGYSDKLSLEYQAYYILNNYRIINDKKLMGGIYATFNDYYLDSPVLVTNNDNQYISTSGLFDRQRQQRVSLATMQSLFNKEKEPLLNVGSFTLKTPFSFIIFGLILAILFVFMINRFKRFREYIFRSVLRPYNFYADIRDQRIMSIFQTLIIGIIIAFILGMYLTSILNYYRSSELAQFVLMMLIPSNSLMEMLFKIVWMPELSMLIISALFFLFAMIMALIIRIFAVFVRARIYYKDTLTITVWSGIPILFLLPFAIVLTRVLVVEPISIFVFLVLIILILLWSVFRMLKSTSVVFDVMSGKVYSIGISILILLAGIPLVIYQVQYSIFAYAKYFVEVLMRI
jgi:hypothetical protein